MTTSRNSLEAVVREAGIPGRVVEPGAVLTLLASLPNPLSAFADSDKSSEMFHTFYGEFSFLRDGRIATKSLQSSDQSRWASLLRWLIHGLREWAPAKDPNNGILVAMIIVAQASDWDGKLWDLLPSDLGENPNLVVGLQNLIGSFSIVFASPGGSLEPIWEREAIEQFNLADAQADWTTIGQRLKPLEHQIFPTVLQRQSVQCLNRCGIAHLVQALAKLRQTLVAMQIASALTIEQKLNVAIRSDNPYVQFGFFYQVFSARQRPQDLPPVEQQLLTALLLRVAQDGPRWNAWMLVFNAHPSHYPALQAPLGHALAAVPEPAVAAYVDSMVLLTMPAKPNFSRQCVAECLRSFRAHANQDRRVALWNSAHKRWTVWMFDQTNQDAHLTGISWSQLDYAIVGFACECMDEDGRANALNAVSSELQFVEDEWHASETTIITAWNRLLSRFQPYAHATYVVISGEDWLPEIRTYLPFDPSVQTYLAMKYRTSTSG